MKVNHSFPWHELQQNLAGELQLDDLTKAIYATDASVYRKIPFGAVFPKHTQDIKAIIGFASQYGINLIPRTAGTSLAGQCVGEGLIVDVSKHLNQIINFDEAKKTVTVQPGVIRDDLNRYLAPYGLFFGPNTSTSNRCMIGGMVGNNSSGTTSIQYGVTRDKVLKLSTVLSDGTEVVFENKSQKQLESHRFKNSLESTVYKKIDEILSTKESQSQITNNYPKVSIHRRNTGYALDVLLEQSFYGKGDALNICNLLTGSEGTLAFTTEVTLQLDDLPPKFNAMVCAHFSTIESCMKAVVPVMKHKLYTCEMMDKTILDCTKNNIQQSKNRFFVVDDPKAILMLELRSDTVDDLDTQVKALVTTLKSSNLSYASPTLYQEDTLKALELRKAGLGLLGNMVGDRKAVACIEDTAVALEDLSEYIKEFSQLMERFKQEAVYYAHAGAGEIHLRPILNLKKSEDVHLFKEITDAVAVLVKKYNGSMSGEHGDGIVRSGYIPQMIGQYNYDLLKQIKQVFDPKGIFNVGKIIDPLSMVENLRYKLERNEPSIQTALDFSDSQGILRVAEKCNGSGDCRKSVAAGGGMCPSYRATNDEKDTTRARANALREVLTNTGSTNKFDSSILKEAFDLCVSCKACSSECPSNVDVASLKAEFLYQYNKSHKASVRDKLFAHNDIVNKWSSHLAGVTNRIFSNNISSSLLKKSLGIAAQRSLPNISSTSFEKWLILFLNNHKVSKPVKQLYLFVDEFTNYLDTQVGKDTVLLLTKLNYKIHFVKHKQSGRAFISKGFLDEAKKVANHNVAVFSKVIQDTIPLVGIEPSAILTFRDEYIRLANDKEKAKRLAKNVLTIDEFLAKEIELKNITKSQFTTETKEVKVHVHCHQKALASTLDTFSILNLPANFEVKIINSGCCGMAGSFGYEKEHYEVSMQMAELSLLPKIRNASAKAILCATGTSCRHQIKDGTTREAQHPVSVLLASLV